MESNLTRLNHLEATIASLQCQLPMFRLAGDTRRADEASDRLYNLKREAQALRYSL